MNSKRFIFFSLAAVTPLAASIGDLPKVDLGYEIHQAMTFDPATETYKFSNIRFAQPPIGDLRFAAPVPPEGISDQVNRGEVGAVCPQAVPVASLVSESVKRDYMTGIPFNETAAALLLEGLQANLTGFVEDILSDPQINEDCLFLDVVVPKAVFERPSGAPGAPVMVWIFGGGWIFNDKNEDPSGIIKASKSSGGDGVIYVALNYRLGTLGWSSGPKFQAEGGTPNAGLLDQRLGLEWVQKHISKFGGDPNRVTLFGISAGGGSILHHITAYGGQKSVPFKQAYMASLAHKPSVDPSAFDDAWTSFLETADVSSLKEARALPSEAVILANALKIGRLPMTFAAYVPTVDGDLVPDHPGILLAEGKFAKDVKVMTSFVKNEFPSGTDPFVNTDEEFAQYFRESFPGVSESSVDHIINALYPPTLDGTHGYDNQYERLLQAGNDFAYGCNTFYLDKAFNNQTHVFQFSVPPGDQKEAAHADDKAYLYYTGDPSTVGGNSDLAVAFQEYITSFAVTGVPIAKAWPEFPVYGQDAHILNFTTDGIVAATDPYATETCNWWQFGLFNSGN
ncbi:hypothetical protein AJ79_05041 [Helicocarpus griseus UAMH5409]|uniref:Carboxylic ester hydrolase n=1 Tax=Helicocarpus griseus UAMH5409 TaxID=1447875 RepID=A0A2B7XQG4_9EURO|nr:hypothetical protein AJ79_05041 [Helicocarpus griseus UAMH5409]